MDFSGLALIYAIARRAPLRVDDFVPVALKLDEDSTVYGQ